MRRRILLTLLASTSIVLVAFLVPLSMMIGDLARDRAQRQVVLEAQPLVSRIPVFSRAALNDLIAQFEEQTGHVATVYFPDGQTAGTSVKAAPEVERARAQGAFFADRNADRNSGRALLVPVYTEDGRAVLQVQVSQAELDAAVSQARLILLALGLALLAVSVGLGLLLARAFLRPISELGSTADRLAAGELRARVPPNDIAEIDKAGRALNRLAARVVELLGLEREEVADLAHRLRTPVAAIRLDADSLPPSESNDRLRTDVDQLDRMVDEVINEARRPLRTEIPASADLCSVARERSAFWQVLAEDQDRELHIDIPPGPLLVAAQERDLTDALDALIGNVFSHTDEGVGFRVSVAVAPGPAYWLEASDDGPGLRSRRVLQRGLSVSGSTGLGLDIARRLAERAGGSIELGSSPSGGARVRLHLAPAGADDE